MSPSRGEIGADDAHPAGMKRRLDDSDTDNDETRKRVRTASPRAPESTGPHTTDDGYTKPGSQAKTKGKGKDRGTEEGPPQPDKPQKRRRKLAPPRPFPTVPTSVSATGPPSSHHEGRNLICVSRKVSLGSYIRRCKERVIKDGYKTLHLSAMGAAIPLLLRLTCAITSVLPHHPNEIRVDITTGTTTVHDEILPDDDDEDITYDERAKSTLQVIIRIGDVQCENDLARPTTESVRSEKENSGLRPAGNASTETGPKSNVVIFQEPEQEML